MSSQAGNNKYGFGSRLLHRFALAWPGIARASLDFELSLAKDQQSQADASEGRHVFISGLARAGTTILLRAMYQTGAFRSLTYRDMPFVLMPVMWQRLSRRDGKQGEHSERAHGDGIDVSFDSPEAFEEVFWRVFCGRQYIKDDHLTNHAVSAEITGLFRQYIKQVIASADDRAQTRYLSKNNNNILRLPCISDTFPEALIVIPFRHPLQQADSLLSQHRRFIEHHDQDRFTCAYMGWLGHYEFGPGHKPFRFSETGTQDSKPADVDHPEYWLQEWLDVYTHILHNKPANSMLVCYEDLCNNPGAYLRYIHSEVGLPYTSSKTDLVFTQASRAFLNDIDSELRDRSLELYATLRSQQNF